MSPTYTTVRDFPYYFRGNSSILRTFERQRCFSDDQYNEMKAIANLVEAPFDKLLEFNHFINSLFSCVSGTVPSSETGRLLHFRTLECGIGLPELLMEAHYTRKGEVVAKAIHHFGHVCFTTGVRKGFSLSLNSNLVYSISPGKKNSLSRWLFNDPWTIVTRKLLLGRECPSLPDAVKQMALRHPPSIFPVFCDGYTATGIKYDGLLPSAFTVSEEHQSIVVGNHFDLPQLPPGISVTQFEEMLFKANKFLATERAESQKRVNAIEQYILRTFQRPGPTGVTVKELSTWLTRTPVKNSATLMACIMDPAEGNILWSAAYQVS